MLHRLISVLVLILLLSGALTGCAHSGRIMTVSQAYDAAPRYAGKRVTIEADYFVFGIEADGGGRLRSEKFLPDGDFVDGISLYPGPATPPENRNYRGAYKGDFHGKRVLVTGVLRYRGSDGHAEVYTFAYERVHLEVAHIRLADKRD